MVKPDKTAEALPVNPEYVTYEEVIVPLHVEVLGVLLFV
jgi:hypothetical protein